MKFFYVFASVVAMAIVARADQSAEVCSLATSPSVRFPTLPYYLLSSNHIHRSEQLYVT